jgi:hypothetical protein
VFQRVCSLFHRNSFSFIFHHYCLFVRSNQRHQMLLNSQRVLQRRAFQTSKEFYQGFVDVAVRGDCFRRINWLNVRHLLC